MLAGLPGRRAGDDLLVGLENGDDGAVVRIEGGRAVVRHRRLLHAGRRRPLRLGPDRGRQRALRRLRDGRRPVGGGEPARLAARPDPVRARRRGAARRRRRLRARRAATSRAATASTTREPKYGLAVTGLADPDRLLRNDAGVAGRRSRSPSRSGLGVLNNRHKATGEVFPEAVATMTRLNRDASRAAGAAGHVCATDVTGFGLLGHLSSSAGPAASPRSSTPRPCRTWRRPGRRSPRATSPAAAAATSTGCARTSRRRVARTSSCCSPTPRPRAGCWSPASCPATR